MGIITIIGDLLRAHSISDARRAQGCCGSVRSDTAVKITEVAKNWPPASGVACFCDWKMVRHRCYYEEANNRHITAEHWYVLYIRYMCT